MSPAKSKLHKDFAERLIAAMARKGWVGRGAATKLAKALGAAPSLVSSWVRGDRMPAGPYYSRLPRVLGISAEALEIGPGVARAERSGDASLPATALQERGSYAEAGVAAWLALGTEMQHNLAVKVIKEALEAQDFAGSPVLRALHGIAQKMDEMGYTAMSRHIWAEMGKYFGQQLPPKDEP